MGAVGGRYLVIDVDGTDYTAQVSRAVITSQETPAALRRMLGPTRSYQLLFTAVQDLSSASLWRLVWDRAGDLVPCLLKPHGNAVATPDLPHYAFTATIVEPDGELLGGEASTSLSARQTIGGVWPLEAKPVEVTG